jgi:hypothetical protein
MNKFLIRTEEMIKKHGLTMTYVSKTQGTYNPATSAVTASSTNHSVVMYPKHVKANSYNYPNLIGKDIILFYLANNALAFIPKLQDSVDYLGVIYKIDSIQSHFAEGEVVLYRILALKA